MKKIYLRISIFGVGEMVVAKRANIRWSMRIHRPAKAALVNALTVGFWGIQFTEIISSYQAATWHGQKQGKSRERSDGRGKLTNGCIPSRKE